MELTHVGVPWRTRMLRAYAVQPTCLWKQRSKDGQDKEEPQAAANGRTQPRPRYACSDAEKSTCSTSHWAASREESRERRTATKSMQAASSSVATVMGYTYHSQDAPCFQQQRVLYLHMHMHMPGPHTAQAGRQVMAHCDRYKAHDPHSRPDWCRQARAKDAG
jgi:hypothetical protein